MHFTENLHIKTKTAHIIEVAYNLIVGIEVDIWHANENLKTTLAFKSKVIRSS